MAQTALDFYADLTGQVDKEAEEKEKKKPGWIGRQAAGARAIRGIKPSGKARAIFNDPKYIKGGLKAQAKGLGAGAAGGAALGALGAKATGKPVAHGAAIGGAVGGLVGQNVQTERHTQKYLKDRGIHRGLLGVKSMTPEAKKKYLHHKYEGGGYGKKKSASVIDTLKELN